MYLFVKFKIVAEKYQQVNLEKAAAQKQQAHSNPFENIDCVLTQLLNILGVYYV